MWQRKFIRCRALAKRPLRRINSVNKPNKECLTIVFLGYISSGIRINDTFYLTFSELMFIV